MAKKQEEKAKSRLIRVYTYAVERPESSSASSVLERGPSTKARYDADGVLTSRHCLQCLQRHEEARSVSETDEVRDPVRVDLRRSSVERCVCLEATGSMTSRWARSLSISTPSG